MSKRAQAISIINANAKLTVSEVVALIATTINVTEANAKSYYRWIIKHKLAPACKDEPTQSKAKPKLAKAKPTKTKQVKAETLLPEVEIERIRAANLARIKEVAARKKYKNVARPSKSTGVPNFDADTARAEVEALDAELSSFVAPKFLSKAQVKALV